MNRASSDERTGVHNSAKDDAQVDAQIGVVHGDVTFYKIDSTATPEERFETGRNYLDGNMPRRAEDIIGSAFADGYRTTRSCYYWILATLSDRTLDLLTESVLSTLKTATSEAEKQPTDQWSTAISAISALITNIADLESVAEPTFVDVDDSMQEFEKLPPDRKNEVRRHLERILSGVVQDRLEAEDAERVANARMGNARTRRALLFFHPPPVEPLRLTLPHTRRTLLLWSGSAFAFLLACAIATDLEANVTHDVTLLVAAGVALLLIGMAVYVLVNLPGEIEGRQQEWRDGRRSGQAWERWTGEPDREHARPRSHRFGKRMRVVLMWSFYHAAADRDVDLRKWLDDTEGIRRTLSWEMAEQFSYRAALPTLPGVTWLANYHAHSHLKAWRDDASRSQNSDEASRTPAQMCVRLIAPLVMATGSALTVLYPRGVASTGVALLALALVVTLMSASICARNAILLRTTRKYIDAQFEKRYHDESAAYDSWKSQLTDRPSDSEMSEWLDHDKLHVKATAMRQYGLSNRDLLDHFFIVGAGAGARSARVAHGPPRYTHYEMWLFLLTSAGVRRMKVQLEVRSGDLTDEERMSFRYDAITAAYVEEQALRPGSTSDRDQEDDDDRSAVAKAIRAVQGKLVLHQLFCLTLNNDDRLDLTLANFDESLWEKVQDDPDRIAQLTRDASGAEAALRILEAVAGEGSAWVEQEKARRRRTMKYHTRNREVLVLMPAPHQEDS